MSPLPYSDDWHGLPADPVEALAVLSEGARAVAKQLDAEGYVWGVKLKAAAHQINCVRRMVQDHREASAQPMAAE